MLYRSLYLNKEFKTWKAQKQFHLTDISHNNDMKYSPIIAKFIKANTKHFNCEQTDPWQEVNISSIIF